MYVFPIWHPNRKCEPYRGHVCWYEPLDTHGLLACHACVLICLGGADQTEGIECRLKAVERDAAQQCKVQIGVLPRAPDNLVLLKATASDLRPPAPQCRRPSISPCTARMARYRMTTFSARMAGVVIEGTVH